MPICITEYQAETWKLYTMIHFVMLMHKSLGFEVDSYCLARGDRGACYAKYEIIKVTCHDI